MGILRNNQNQYEPIRIEDCEDEVLINEYGNYLFDSDFSESEPEGDEHKIQHTLLTYDAQRKKKPKRFRRNYGPIEIVDGLQIRRNMGAQKWRRVENAKLIMAYNDMKDVCFDGSDLIEETITAFTLLLRDEEKMKTWNEFIELDEAKQAKMIDNIERKVINEKSKLMNEPGPSKKFFGNKQAADFRKQQSQDFSAEKCFQRVDKRLRDCLLKRRYVRFDYMKEIELTLRGFFSEFSSGVYFEDIACRIKRFYVHAVAQFLQLNSQTIESGDSKKLVQIENGNPTFNPPKIFLGDFLKKKRRNRKLSANAAKWDFD